MLKKLLMFFKTLFGDKFFSSKKNIAVFVATLFFCACEIVGIGKDWVVFKRYKDVQREATKKNIELKVEETKSEKGYKEIWENRVASLHILPSIMLVFWVFFLLCCLVFRCLYLEELHDLHEEIEQLVAN